MYTLQNRILGFHNFFIWKMYSLHFILFSFETLRRQRIKYLRFCLRKNSGTKRFEEKSPAVDKEVDRGTHSQEQVVEAHLKTMFA